MPNDIPYNRKVAKEISKGAMSGGPSLGEGLSATWNQIKGLVPGMGEDDSYPVPSARLQTAPQQFANSAVIPEERVVHRPIDQAALDAAGPGKLTPMQLKELHDRFMAGEKLPYDQLQQVINWSSQQDAAQREITDRDEEDKARMRALQRMGQ